MIQLSYCWVFLFKNMKTLFQKNICTTMIIVALFVISRKNIYFCFDCVDHNKLWKILKEMGIPDPLTCLLRNLYAGQEATVRTGHRTTDWFQTGKTVHQGCILSPCLFNLYTEYIMRSWTGGSTSWNQDCWEKY